MISFKPTDRLLTYASYSRGYKAGGFNLDRAAPSTARPAPRPRPARFFDPETGRRVRDRRQVQRPLDRRQRRRVRRGTPQFPAEHVQRRQFPRREHQQLLGRSRRSRQGQQLAARRLRRQRSARRSLAGRRGRNLLPPDPRRKRSRSASTWVDTRYRNNLVGDRRQCADSGAVPASRPAGFQRARLHGHRLARLDSADRRQRPARPVLRRCPAHDRASTPAPISFLEKLEDGVHRGQRPRRRPRAGRQLGLEVWAQNLLDEKYEQVAFNAPLQGAELAPASNAASIRRRRAFRHVPGRAADVWRDLARQARLRARPAAGRSRAAASAPPPPATPTCRTAGDRRRACRRRLLRRRLRRPARESAVSGLARRAFGLAARLRWRRAAGAERRQSLSSASSFLPSAVVR